MWTFSLWSVLTFVVCDWDDCVLRNFEGAIHFGILNARWLLYTLNRFVFLNTSFTQRGKRVGGNKACLHLPKITVLCRANSRLEIETFSGGEHRVQGLIISLKACQRGRQSRWSGQSQSHLFHPTAQPTSCPWEINTLRTWAWRNDGCFPCVVYICASQKNKSIYNLKSYSRSDLCMWQRQENATPNPNSNPNHDSKSKTLKRAGAYSPAPPHALPLHFWEFAYGR